MCCSCNDICLLGWEEGIKSGCRTLGSLLQQRSRPSPPVLPSPSPSSSAVWKGGGKGERERTVDWGLPSLSWGGKGCEAGGLSNLPTTTPAQAGHTPAHSLLPFPTPADRPRGGAGLYHTAPIAPQINPREHKLPKKLRSAVP